MVQFLVPIIQITLFCICIGKVPSNLNIGYYSEDNVSLSIDIGKMFIENLDEKIVVKKEFKNLNDGMDELKNGNLWCLIKIDHNFSYTLAKRLLLKFNSISFPF